MTLTEAITLVESCLEQGKRASVDDKWPAHMTALEMVLEAAKSLETLRAEQVA